MKSKFFLLAAILPIFLAGAAPAAEPEVITDSKPAAAPDAKEPAPAVDDAVALLETSAGPIVVEFWPEVAPETVKNFKKLAGEKFYDGTAFHRIIRGFMAQGGDPLTKDPEKRAVWGTGNPGYKIKAEFNTRKHKRGVISMARSQDPDSAGSQFFLMFGDAPFLDGQYTAFGNMIAGDEALTKIEGTKVAMARSGEASDPIERIELKSVRILPKAEALKAAGANKE